MTSFVDPDQIDAQRWLYLHDGQVLGAKRAEAVDFVRAAGLIPQVSPYRDEAREVVVWNPVRIRLFIDDDDSVRSVRFG